MGNKLIKKVRKSNKIFPFYYGFSLDLMFWAAMSTLFLTNVKKFNASEINSLTAISIITCVFGYFIALKIIKKIGNLKSIRIGNILLLIASLLITFPKSYYGVLIGFVFYQYAFLFKSIDNVLLRNNLKFLGEEDKFFKYQSKGTLIYSLMTLVIAFIAGYLFNINNYLPMYISIFYCFINVFLTFFICEAPINLDEKQKEKERFKFNKAIIFILLFQFLIAALIDIGQTNSKLFLQYNMAEFLNVKKVVLNLSIIIFISRIFRVVSNIFFNKFYDKLQKYLPVILNILLILSFASVLIGNLIKNGYIGIAIMSFGFMIYLSIRDTTENYGRTILFSSCEEKYHDDVAIYFSLVRKIGDFLFSLVVSIILLKLSMKYAFIFLLVMSIVSLYVTINIYKIAKKV